MKFNLPINNFAAGEWSPRMRGRTDTEQYLKACEDLTNFIPQMTGGAEYRAGTFLQSAGTTGQAALNVLVQGGERDFKIIPYIPSSAFPNWIALICGGATKWKNLFLGTDMTYKGATSTTGWVAESTDYVQIGDLLIVTTKTGQFSPKVIYHDPATSTLTVADLIGEYVTVKPWTANPWDKINAFDSANTLTIPAITNTVGSSFTLTSNTAYFNQASVGKYIRLCNGTSLDGVVQVTAYLTTTTATVIIRQVLHIATAFTFGSTTNNTSFWQESQWNKGAVIGPGNIIPDAWPCTVTAHQGRLIFGGNYHKPDAIWGSRISNIFDFQEVPSPNTTGVYGFASNAWTSDNSRPFTLRPNTGITGGIVALSSAKTLMINTSLSEITAYGSNGALGPNNVVFETSTSFGASPVNPVRINNYLTFVQGNGTKVRDIIYNFDQDQYKSSDLSFVADHFYDVITPQFPTNGDRIEEMTRWENSSSVLVVRTRLGRLYCVTLDRDYEVNAWSKIVLGKAEVQDSVEVMSICTTFNPSLGAQTLNMIAVRVENGEEVFSWETFAPAWRVPNPYIGGGSVGVHPIYLDATSFARPQDPALPFNDPTTEWMAANFADINHYKGYTVSVVGDGNYLGEVTLGMDDDGVFTTPHPCRTVIIGFKYPGIIKTFPIEAGGQTGVPMGRIKRVDEATVRFYNSVGCLVGHSEDTLEDIPMRDPGQPMDQPIAYYTGDKVVNWPAGYDRDYQVILKQDKPYPIHVVAIALQGTTYD